MNHSILIKGGTIVTMDSENSVLTGDLLATDGRLTAVGGEVSADGVDVVIDARGCVVLPGFVQTHVHLCQTLFRGAADDLSLIDWLRKRVWPMEAAHTPASLRAAARLAVAELIRGGTTCALTMETVSGTDEVFQVVEAAGFRATVGKCMMDHGDEVPPALRETTEDSIGESLALLEKWHGRAGGRLRYCFAPRFALSCTPELLRQVAALAPARGVLIHTHASENRVEVEMVRRETGQQNVDYLHALGLVAPHVVLAHCVHVNAEEIELLAGHGAHVAHCPSSNLKLGSGIAPISEMLARGVSVTLGADGAPCNNRLDMFTEMRTAALLQKGVGGDARALPADRVLRMATCDGARALGLGHEIGSFETGKRADITIIDLERPHLIPRPHVISAIVYAAQASDTRTVIIDGQIVMRDRQLLTIDERELLSETHREGALLMSRANIQTANGRTSIVT